MASSATDKAIFQLVIHAHNQFLTQTQLDHSDDCADYTQNNFIENHRSLHEQTINCEAMSFQQLFFVICSISFDTFRLASLLEGRVQEEIAKENNNSRNVRVYTLPCKSLGPPIKYII